MVIGEPLYAQPQHTMMTKIHRSLCACGVALLLGLSQDNSVAQEDGQFTLSTFDDVSSIAGVWDW